MAPQLAPGLGAGVAGISTRVINVLSVNTRFLSSSALVDSGGGLWWTLEVDSGSEDFVSKCKVGGRPAEPDLRQIQADAFAPRFWRGPPLISP